ncbi:hypothetical protein [Clostridium sp. DL1XJH146]
MDEKRHTIKTLGVSSELPENPLYFTEISIVETLKIPPEKPDIEQVLTINVEPEILSMRIADTPCAVSYEGHLLSGKKLIMELKLREKVIYVADETTQPAHAAHYEDVMQSVFVVVPKQIDNIPIERLLKADRIIVSPYIEDIYAEQKDNRTVFKNITMLIDVTISC